MIKPSHVLDTAFLLLAPVFASAGITVTYHNFEFDNAEIEIVPGQIYLEDVAASPDYPSASIRNLLHHSFADECFGDSQIGFVRHRYTEDICAYFFRATDLDANAPENGEYYAVENWGRVYWMGDNQLVDGAIWGSDNYVLMRDLSTGKSIAVLQLNFDQNTGLATLVASAIALDGLTFSQGVRAISGIPIPEPASFATLAAAGALGLAATHRRRRR